MRRMDLDPAPWAEPRYDRVEWYPSLDVNHLRRVGALALDNGVGGWSVSQTKGVRVLVTYDHAQRCACLNCDGDGTWVVIDWTPCRFGGDRPWFLCPMCATRRVKLHLVAGTWGRAAYVTPWATRLNGSRDRLLLKAVRLRSRVGQTTAMLGDLIPAEAKAWRWQRYCGLHERVFAAELEVLSSLRTYSLRLLDTPVTV